MRCEECGGKATCVDDNESYTKWECAEPKNAKCRYWSKVIMKPKKK